VFLPTKGSRGGERGKDTRDLAVRIFGFETQEGERKLSDRRVEQIKGYITKLYETI